MSDEVNTYALESISSEGETFILGEFALISMQKNFHKLIQSKADIFKDQDLEPLHQTRVRMRRLRTALIVFAPFISLSTQLERDIKQISKSLGLVRDLDVLGLWFQDFMADSALDRAELKPVKRALKHLSRQRQKRFKQMCITLKGNRYQQFAEEFQLWLKSPKFRAGAEWPIYLVLPDLLLPLINQLLLHPGWLTAIAPHQKSAEPEQAHIYLAEYGTVLHDLRKQVKRVRYQTEFFKDFYDSAYAEQTLELRTIQDLLGQLQDSRVLCDFLAKAAGLHWQKAMPSLEDYLRKQHLEQWQRWQLIQQKYLNPKFRENLRMLILRPQGRNCDGSI